MSERPFILSPSLLSADWLRLGEQIAELENAGADWLHIDVMDGHFAPNLSMGPAVVAACKRAADLPLDVHLMIETPERMLEDFIRAGANLITIHVETGYHPARVLQAIRQAGCRPGIALNPGTPYSAIEGVLPLVEMVLVLGSNPGFSGQAYLPFVTEKIRAIRRAAPDVWIEVDGGVNRDTLAEVLQAGADVIVAGNAVFNHPGGIAAGVAELREIEARAVGNI